MTDFREVAAGGWYGSPASVTEDRATEIFDAVADYVISSIEEVWKSLQERGEQG